MAVSKLVDQRHGVIAHFCDECHRLIDPINDEPYEAVKEGEDVVVCDSCKQEHYAECEKCHDLMHENEVTTYFTRDGSHHSICSYCADEEAM